MTIHDVPSSGTRAVLGRMLSPRGVWFFSEGDGAAASSLRRFRGVAREGGLDDHGSEFPWDVVVTSAERFDRELVQKATLAGAAVLWIERGETGRGDGIDDSLELAAAMTLGVVDGGAATLHIPSRGLALGAAGDGEVALASGGVALVEWAEHRSRDLVGAASARGTAVSVALDFSTAAHLDPVEVLRTLGDHDDTRVVLLSIGSVDRPGELLEAIRSIRESGREVIALTSRVPEEGVFPDGLGLRTLIDAALTAEGVAVVETIEAGLILADLLTAEATSDGLRFRLPSVFEADKLRSLLAREGGLPGLPIAVVEGRSRADAAGDDGAAPKEIVCERADAAIEALRLRRGLSAETVGEDGHNGLDIELETLLGHLPRGELNAVQAADLLSVAGLPHVPFVTVRTGTEAIAAGLDIGFPIVAKALIKGGLDKTEVGAVVSDVPRLKDLRKTVAGFQKAHPDRFEAAILQPHVAVRAEVHVGVLHDPEWGDFVWMRSGGAVGRVVDDTVIARAPLDPRRAERIVAGLAAVRAAVADGAVDVAAARDVIVDLGRLIRRHALDIAVLELHPLALLREGDGAFVLDARAVLRERAGAGSRPPLVARLSARSGRKRKAHPL